MTSPVVPNFDTLKTSGEPCWLWDGARRRIAWANPAGIRYFGGETLFDLIDRPFDSREPGVKRIRELCGELQRGDVVSERLDFPSAPADSSIDCICTPHALADGRQGLLAVAEETRSARAARASRLMTGVLAAMPIAIVVTGADGMPVFQNKALADLFDPDRLSSLAGLMDDGDAAHDFLAQVEAAGTVTAVHTLQTVHGLREVRLTGRLLEDGAAPAGVQILTMMEDVTDRRALERSLMSSADMPALCAPAAPEDLGEPVRTRALLSEEDRQIFEKLSNVPVEAEAQPDAEAQDEDAGASDDVPELVRSWVDGFKEPVLLHRHGKVIYGNSPARAIMDCGGNAGKMMASLPAVGDLQETVKSTLSLDGSGGETIGYSVHSEPFPWFGGAAVRSALLPIDEAAPAAKFEQPGMSEKPPAQEPTQAPAADEAGSIPEAAPEDESVLEDVPEPPPVAQAQVTASETAPEPDGYPDGQPGPSAGEPQTGVHDDDVMAILDTATDGIITLDRDGRIVSFSAGAEAMFGYRRAEVSGKYFSDLLETGSRKTLQDYLSALGDSGIASVFNDGREVEAIVQQGGVVPAFITVSRMTVRPGAAGPIPAFCVVVRDITQWKKTEAELRQARDAAERSNKQKSEFLAKISHELRTPLNAILGFSEVMRTQRFGEIRNDKYLGYANDIHQSGEHLLSLINDLLDLSKVESGKLELNFTSVDLAGVVAEAFAVVQEQAKAARVILRRNLKEDLPHVVADLRSMKQIMLNVLSNAIKFTDPGGQVVVSANLKPSGELNLRIKDTGIGMSEAELERALEPFSRVHDDERREREGTGLGLPLTKALAQANRARLDVSSEPNKGTQIDIVFPATRVLAE